LNNVSTSEDMRIDYKLVDECRRYSKLKQCHFLAWLKRPIFGLHDSKGSAETLVRRRRGGITNHHLIAYSLSYLYQKKYQNRLMCIVIVIVATSVSFFETQCITLSAFPHFPAHMSSMMTSDLRCRSNCYRLI